LELISDWIRSRMKSSDTGPVINLTNSTPPPTKMIAVRDRNTNAAVFQNRRKLRSPD
jgi:hypothetical protein